MGSLYNYDPDEHAEAEAQLDAAQSALSLVEEEMRRLDERDAELRAEADALDAEFAREALTGAAPRQDLLQTVTVNRAAAAVCEQRVEELRAELRPLRQDVNQAMLAVQKQERWKRSTAQLRAAPGGVLVRVGTEMRPVPTRE